MASAVRKILEMIRFSHTLFALPFALLAALLAWTAVSPAGGRTPFSWLELVGILLCMVFARSAAMAFNRLADRRIDAKNPRTKGRHLPAGELSVFSVAAFTAASAAGFFASTLLFLPNWLPAALALPVLAFLLAYSFTKRFTSLAHFWLGAALMLAPLSAWIAIRGEVLLAETLDLLAPLALGAAVLLWVAGFDIIYACQDHEFDKAARLKSVPVALGVRGALRAAAGCHLAMIAVLAMLPLTPLAGGPQIQLGWIFYLGVAAVAALLVYEHAIVRPDDLSRVNLAFFHVNTIVSLGLLGAAALDIYL